MPRRASAAVVMLVCAAALGAAAKIDPAWLEGDEFDRERLRPIEGKPAPALKVEKWINAHKTPVLTELKGKVVLLDFWGTWCTTCLHEVPHLNELAEKYGEAGLVVIGVCNSEGAEVLADTVRNHHIRYPVAADVDNATWSAYRVNGTPDYYVIDRAGVLRAADVNTKSVDEVVKALLAEDAVK